MRNGGRCMSSVLAKRLSLILAAAFLSSHSASATNAPSNLSAAGASSSQVNLTWTDNSTNETGFTFAFDTNSGLTNPAYVYAGGANTTSYLHTGRAPATTYYYKIKAEGNPDSAWTAVTGATTAPSGLTATAPSNSEIDLTWTATEATPPSSAIPTPMPPTPPSPERPIIGWPATAAPAPRRRH